MGIWFSRDLLRWLLYPVRRKLWISYTFVGFIPVALLGLFSTLLFYVALGQFAFYVFDTNLRSRAEAFGAAAREALIGLPEVPTDEEARQVLSRVAEQISERTPGAAAWYLERDGLDPVRLVGSRPGGPIPPDRPLPEWASVPRQRLVIPSVETEWFGAVYPHPDGRRMAFVLAPLVPVLQTAAREEGLAVLDLWTLYFGDDTDPVGPRGFSDEDRDGFAMPWLETVLLEASPWEREAAGGTVLVRFGFDPIRLLEGAATTLSDPLAVNSALGGSLLLALAALGIVFLGVWIGAFTMGFRIARSITRSVETLSRGTDRVRSGDFGHAVRVRSADQLGELAQSFNIMTAKIADDMERLRRAARLEQEMETARLSQERLLPPKGSVSIPGFSVAAVCRPAAEVGGDYYDLIPLGPRRLGVVIADVSGTGARAAFTMAELKGLILGLSRIHNSPRRVLIEANRVLYEALDARTFITITYAIFDSESRTVTFARAGHSPTLRLRRIPGGACSEALAPKGLGLALGGGSVFDTRIEEMSRPLDAGEVWLFFTDGVSEAMNAQSDMFGEERLMRLLEDHYLLPPADLERRIEEEVLRFTGNRNHADDLTMVLVKVA